MHVVVWVRILVPWCIDFGARSLHYLNWESMPLSPRASLKLCTEAVAALGVICASGAALLAAAEEGHAAAEVVDDSTSV